MATLQAIGLNMDEMPGIRLDLDDRPQKSPRACVIASDPPNVVHLITRAQGGLHDYQAFLHEAGHALHYASVDPALPYTFRKISRDHALTEIYSLHRRGDLARAGLARRALRARRRAGGRERRGDRLPRGAPLPPLRREAAVRARLLGPLRRGRRHARRLLRAADRGDRASATRPRTTSPTWTRASTRPTTCAPGSAPRSCGSTSSGEVGRGLVAPARDRASGCSTLWREGTRPTSEEIASRIGYEPFDTGPLLHELGA